MDARCCWGNSHPFLVSGLYPYLSEREAFSRAGHVAATPQTPGGIAAIEESPWMGEFRSS